MGRYAKNVKLYITDSDAMYHFRVNSYDTSTEIKSIPNQSSLIMFVKRAVVGSKDLLVKIKWDRIFQVRTCLKLGYTLRSCPLVREFRKMLLYYT